MQGGSSKEVLSPPRRGEAIEEGLGVSPPALGTCHSCPTALGSPWKGLLSSRPSTRRLRCRIWHRGSASRGCRRCPGAAGAGERTGEQGGLVLGAQPRHRLVPRSSRSSEMSPPRGWGRPPLMWRGKQPAQQQGLSLVGAPRDRAVVRRAPGSSRDWSSSQVFAAGGGKRGQMTGFDFSSPKLHGDGPEPPLQPHRVLPALPPSPGYPGQDLLDANHQLLVLQGVALDGAVQLGHVEVQSAQRRRLPGAYGAAAW